MNYPRKYTPYLFIGTLCVLAVFVRGFILVGFPWYFHILAFIGQFLGMSALWQLIVFINSKLEKRFSLEESPATQVLLQVTVTIILLSPVFILSYWLMQPFLPDFFSGKVLILWTILPIFLVLMMTFGYYAYTLFSRYRQAAEEKASLRLAAVELEKEKSLMRFHHLKNQVNPHFLFNSFSALDGLIQSQPGLASQFVRHLSQVYRYVLEHKENEVVSLETEMKFIGHYISLLSIRYGAALQISTGISAAGKERGLVMVTLQMLIDNAIKHNIVESGRPLKIRIQDQGEYLLVSNNRQLRRQIEHSGRLGLKQLKELYAYLSDKPLQVLETADKFEVMLPLL